MIRSMTVVSASLWKLPEGWESWALYRLLWWSRSIGLGSMQSLTF